MRSFVTMIMTRGLEISAFAYHTKHTKIEINGSSKFFNCIQCSIVENSDKLTSLICRSMEFGRYHLMSQPINGGSKCGTLQQNSVDKITVIMTHRIKHLNLSPKVDWYEDHHDRNFVATSWCPSRVSEVQYWQQSMWVQSSATSVHKSFTCPK